MQSANVEKTRIKGKIIKITDVYFGITLLKSPLGGGTNTCLFNRDALKMLQLKKRNKIKKKNYKVILIIPSFQEVLKMHLSWLAYH